MGRKCTKIAAVFLMACLVAAGVFAVPATVHAKKITSISQVKKMALKKVKNASVLEVDTDYEKGTFVYEVKLLQKTKVFDLTYRASDGKLIQYGWEETSVKRNSGKKIISQSKCKKLAKKKVPGAEILSISRKRDDGIDQYKVKMQKGKRKYELEYHARTGKLIEYEWKETLKPKPSNNNYIGVERAKEIALSEVPGATITKVEFDRDDGVPVYEVEFFKGPYEYDIKIHAVTGKILDFDHDYRDGYGDYDYDDDYDDDDYD